MDMLLQMRGKYVSLLCSEMSFFYMKKMCNFYFLEQMKVDSLLMSNHSYRE